MNWSPSDPSSAVPARAGPAARVPLLPGLFIGAWFSAVVALIIGALLGNGGPRAPADGPHRHPSGRVGRPRRWRPRCCDAYAAAVTLSVPRSSRRIRTGAGGRGPAALVQLEEYAAAVARREAARRTDRGPTRSCCCRCKLGLLLRHDGRPGGGGAVAGGRGAVSLRVAPGGRADGAYATTLNNVADDLSLADLGLGTGARYAGEAVSLRPLEPSFIDTLGWVYFQSGDYDQAVFYLERAARLALPQTNPEIEYHLGAAYARARQAHRRPLAMQRAAARDPENRRIQDELQRLQWELPSPMMAQAAG